MNKTLRELINETNLNAFLFRLIAQFLHRLVPYNMSAWLAAVVLFHLAMFSSTSVLGQENAIAIQSKAFAEKSTKLLGTGQKRAAIIEGLKGLPEPFTQETIIDYPEAWLSFYRAATALIVVTSYDGDMMAVANRDRTRVVFKGILAADQESLSAVTPTVLWNTENNREIAIVAQAADINDDNRSLAYELSTSPSADLFSLVGSASKEIKLFDIQNGVKVETLSIPPQPLPFGISPIGLSPDGTKFAASSIGKILVWDLGTSNAPREIVPQFPEGTTGLLLAQNKWTSEEDFVATYTWFQGPKKGQSGLVHIRKDGTVQSVESDGFDVISLVSQSAPYFLALSSSQNQWLVRDLQLNIVGRISSQISPISFARDQTAIVFMQGMGGMFGEDTTFEPVAIYKLDGTALELQPTDYLGFSDLIFNESGQMLAVIGPASYSATHLSGSPPNAAELYAMTMASLTEEEDTILSTQRLGASVATLEVSQLRMLQSNQLASEAESAMLRGQRHKAIKLALSALPAMPSQTDFQTFEKAHRALYRAYTSRSATFNGSENHMSFFLSRVRFGPAGRNALYRRFSLAEPTRGKFLTRATLYDLQTDHASEIDLTTIDPRGFTDLSFSPDGAEFAGVGKTDGKVYVFDTSTGEVTRFFDVSGDTVHTKTVQIGFSPDGRYFAATVGDISDSRFAIWAAETGKLLYSGTPLKGFATPLGWTHEGSILFVERPQWSEETTGPDNLVLWSPQGESMVMPLIREDGRPIEHCQYSAISHALPYLACSADSETTIIDFVSGSILGTVRRASSVGTFLRNGSAIGWQTVSNSDEIDVFSVTGAPLEPTLQDYVPFGQMAFLKGSDLSRVAADLSGYSGQDMPTGLELYKATMTELSEDERATLLLE